MVLDVKGAYLKTPIGSNQGEQIYIRLPTKRIVKLLKYLYGLKQSGKRWQYNERSRELIMCIHVDDSYVIASHVNLLESLYRQLVDEFEDITRTTGNVVSSSNDKREDARKR